MATTPLFVATPFATPCVSFNTVSTDRTGGGTYATILTGASGGSLVSGIAFRGITQTIQTMLLLFHDDGSNVKLIGEILVGNVVPSSRQGGWSDTWTPPGGSMLIANGDELQVAAYSGSATYVAHALGGNL